jgi:hypothetical protein
VPRTWRPRFCIHSRHATSAAPLEVLAIVVLRQAKPGEGGRDERIAKLGNPLSVPAGRQSRPAKAGHQQVRPALGAAVAMSARRSAYQRQTRTGSRRKAWGVATSSGRSPCQSPWASRNVGSPLSADMPAPVSTATLRAPRSAAARSLGT